MARHTIDFKADLPKIQKYIVKQVKKQANDSEPISAIEIGFKLCQAHALLFNFDTREEHDRDGEWTAQLDDDDKVLELPAWCDAYMDAGEFGINFTLLSGKSVSLPPKSGDHAVAGVFGTELLTIAQDALNGGVFDALPLATDCQLEVDEFDGMWSWPAKYEDLGKTNLVNALRRAKRK